MTIQTIGAWQKPFLEHYRNTCNLRASARAVGIDYSTVSRAVKRDPDFKAAFDIATQEALDLVEMRAFEGATRGWERRHYMKNEDGEPVMVWQYYEIDTGLVRFILSRRRPEVWGEKAKELGGDQPMPQAKIDLSRLTNAQLAALKEIVQAGTVLPIQELEGEAIRDDGTGDGAPGAG